METMDIYSEKGTKIIYTGEHGYDFQREDANVFLKVGETYTVDHTIVYNWSSGVMLKEVPNKYFNTVHFITASGHKTK